MDDKDLRANLRVAFQVIKEQRLAYIDLKSRVSAVQIALKKVPGFDEEYQKQFLQLSGGITGLQDASTKLIDDLISRLQ